MRSSRASRLRLREPQANLLPKNHVIYGWSGQGVTGTDTVAKLDTSNLAPGTYTVNGTVKEGKPGKEGLKPWESGVAPRLSR